MQKTAFIHIIIFLVICSSKNIAYAQKLTGDKISKNFIKVIGGKKKLKQVKTMSMIATAQIQGIELQIESYRKAPNKMVVRMKSPQGTITRILNGDRAVVVTPNGNQEIKGIDLDALKEEATIFPELYKDEFEYEFKFIGIENINGRETYKVKVLQPSGIFRFQFYDKETSLLNKMIDEIGNESYYEDYREIDGVKIPYTNKLVTPQGTLNFRIKEITINPQFDKGMFELQ